MNAQLEVSKILSSVPEDVIPQQKKILEGVIPLKKKKKPSKKKISKKTDKKSSVKQPDKPLNLALIGAAPFIWLAKLKSEHKTEIIAISMQDIEYQLNKVTKPLTDPKTVVLAKYYDYLDVFSKDAFNTLRSYGKYNHTIELFKDAISNNLGHSALRGILAPQLEFVKKFFEEHLKKKFIESSNALCS